MGVRDRRAADGQLERDRGRGGGARSAGVGGVVLVGDLQRDLCAQLAGVVGERLREHVVGEELERHVRVVDGRRRMPGTAPRRR